MQKRQLFDLIRRVSELTGIDEPVIAGSQSLFAVTDTVPSIVSRSIEADFLLGPHGPEVMHQVGASLGMRSDFFDQQGYYADPLGMATVVLVPGWRDRLQPLKDETGKTVALCLEVYDLAVSKLMAGRDKDMIFLCNLLDGQMIMMSPLMQRTELVKETAFDGALIPRLERFESHLRSQRYINYNLAPLRELLARLK